MTKITAEFRKKFSSSQISRRLLMLGLREKRQRRSTGKVGYLEEKIGGSGDESTDLDPNNENVLERIPREDQESKRDLEETAGEISPLLVEEKKKRRRLVKRGQEGQIDGPETLTLGAGEGSEVVDFMDFD